MTNRIFTDEEIRKALECCASYDCTACPLYSPTINCVIVLPEKALELVDRYRAEIERLNKEVDRLSQCVLYHDGIVSDLEKDVFNAKAEAIKELAENVKAIFECDLCFGDDVKSYILNEIDSIVKEMTEGNNESQNT